MSKIDLNKHCALCGMLLPYLHGFDMADRRDQYRLQNLLQSDAEGKLDVLEVRCKCEGRGKPGECGICPSCRIERHGCACDGAYDDGCFQCNPTKYERPPCPTATQTATSS